jgi:hypothetical protein
LLLKKDSTPWTVGARTPLRTEDVSIHCARTVSNVCRAVPSAHRVCLVLVRSPVLISDILIQASIVVPQSLDSNAISRPRPFYVLSNI